MLLKSLPIMVFTYYLLFVPAVAFPQEETTSAIVGQVKDTTGAAIPGAVVTIANRETGLQRSATTDNQGRFDFPQLKPGTYSVKATADGFAPQQIDNVVSGLGQKQAVNFNPQTRSSQTHRRSQWRSESIREFRKTWKTATAKVAVGNILFHDLRRSAVRDLIRAGVSQSVAMKISGHRTAAIFQRYDIVVGDDLKPALEKNAQYRMG